MSAKADKGDRKREIEQSPMKKKFRDSAISSEDLDDAIASRIELAFKEHQSTLNSVVNSAVRDAMDSMLIPALPDYPVKCAQSNDTLLFFPDFSPATAIRRKAFGPVLKKMTALGLQPFLIYPAVIKLRHKGEQMSFDSPQKAWDFISSLSQQKTYATALREGNWKTAATISPARWERLDGREGGGSRCPGRDDDRMDMKAWTCLLLFLLSFLLLGYCPYLSGTTISLLVRLTPLRHAFRQALTPTPRVNAAWARARTHTRHTPDVCAHSDHLDMVVYKR